MLPLLLLLQAQATLPQVGDTVWLVRTIPVPAGREVRVASWSPEGAVEALGPGVVVRRGDSLDIRYPAVGWLPGSHRVDVPGPVLVAPDGATDSLPGETYTVTIASVLPPLPGDSLPPPQPEAGPILLPERNPGPVVVGLLLAGVLLAPLHYWRRRRRGAAAAPAATTPTPVPEAPVDAWAEAGEPRAVLAAAATRLRMAAGAAPPPEATALLEVLDTTLYGPGDARPALASAEAALALAASLERRETP